MKKSSGPVKKFPLAEQAMKDFTKAMSNQPLPDFSDTEKSFAHLDDDDLKHNARMFGLMGKTWLTNIMSSMGVPAVKLGLPGAAWMVKNTVLRRRSQKHHRRLQ